MQTQGAPPAPSSPVPVQTASALTASTPTTQTAHAAQVASPVSTTSHTPVHSLPTAQPAQPAPTAAPPAKTAVPPPSSPTVTTPPVVDPADPPSAEARLEKEVEVLWQDHKQAKSSARKTNKALKLLRDNLARKLHELKNMLARPGCKGEWSSFLDNHSISRTTANRLVDTHQKLITPAPSNSPSGTTVEPMEVVVRRCLDLYWKRLSPVLSTPESVELFIGELRNRAQKSFGADDEAPDSSASDVAAQTE